MSNAVTRSPARQSRLQPPIPRHERHTGGHAAAERFPFRPEVEGLRGVAILLVVAYHVGLPGITGGFIGVDVFFVLSGYLITGLLLAELTATGTIGFAAFYARRVRRLLPAGATALVGTLLLAALVEPPLQIATAAESARAAAAFVSNLFFASRSADYFGAGVDSNPLLHTWSLSVEEQFYVVWPCLVLLAAGRAASRRRLALALGAVAAASLAASWWYTLADRPTAFYGMPTRAWEFAAGAAVALLPSLGTGRSSRARRAPTVAAGWLGLAAIAAAAVRYSARTPFPGVYAVLPVVGTMLILLRADGPPSGAVARLLSTGPMQWVGRHSYAWYLWHWPLLVLGADALAPVGVAERAGLALVALALAAATRVLVEEPVRRGRALRDRPRHVVALGLAGVASLVAIAASLRAAAARAAESPAQRLFSAAVRDLPRPYQDACSPALRDATVRTCTYGAADARTTVVLFGDSHAAHLFPALDAIARSRRWRLLVLTKWACPSVGASVYDLVLRRTFDECDAWRRAALDTIRARRPALVVLSNSTEYVLDGPEREPHASVAPRAWERGLTTTLGALRTMGVPVAVLQDVPHAPENVPNCLRRAAWRGRDRGVCDFPRNAAVHRAAAEATRGAVAAFPEDRVIDLADAMCDAARCAAERAGVVRYRDARHLTATAAVRLAPALDTTLDAALLGAGLLR